MLPEEPALKPFDQRVERKTVEDKMYKELSMSSAQMLSFNERYCTISCH